MLIGNRSVFLKSPLTFRNGPGNGSLALNNLSQTGRNRNIYVQDNQQTIDRKNGVPLGYRPPYVYVLAQKDGGLGSFSPLRATITSSLDIADGRNILSNISGTIAVTQADGGLVTYGTANISATMTITQADLAAVVNAIAGLSASGDLGSPILGALAGIVASLSGSIVVTSASLNDSPGHMGADILPYTVLSPESLAAAVLNALLVEYNAAGTVGEALNNIGASANPWAAALASNTTDGTFGKRVQELLTTNKFIGLK